MPRIAFEAEDFLRGKIVPPAWYEIEVKDASGEKPSKDGGSTNYPVEVTIIKNDEDNSVDYAGVPVIINFNSKARGFIIGYLEALGVKVEPGQAINLEATQGRRLVAYIENSTYEGKVRNNINHKYRAVRS